MVPSASSQCQGVTIFNVKASVSNYSREGVSKRGARRCHLLNVPGPVWRGEDRLSEKAGRGSRCVLSLPGVMQAGLTPASLGQLERVGP